jgi:hypothetical protein
MKFSKKLTKKSLKKGKKKMKMKMKRFHRDPSTKKKSNSKTLFIIQTPYNSNEFLIDNQSTPFFEEEEEDFNFFPSELNNYNNSEIKDFVSFENESTNGSSNINSELIKI